MKIPFFGDMWSDFLNLFFPENCLACGNSLFKHERCICTHCIHHLPRTNYHQNPENPVVQLFWGRFEFQYGFSFLYFKKGTRTQKLLHNLKYRNKEVLGEEIGRLYGKELTSAFKNTFDLIVPVPLHRNKLKKRGYNQSAAFARGLAEAMQTGVDCESVVRKTETQTQTRKAKYDRWVNVSDVFAVSNKASFEGKHVLIVDDVITTGATIEAMAQSLKEAGCDKISVASIASA